MKTIRTYVSRHHWCQTQLPAYRLCMLMRGCCFAIFSSMVCLREVILALYLKLYVSIHLQEVSPNRRFKMYSFNGDIARTALQCDHMRPYERCPLMGVSVSWGSTLFQLHGYNLLVSPWRVVSSKGYVCECKGWGNHPPPLVLMVIKISNYFLLSFACLTVIFH